jgi:phosphoribosylformimino-5-aminoimidazole carboxamide ribotide isomerase
MKFRPCIDLHKGKVKQIVGSSYTDDDTPGLITNFETNRSPADFASMYNKDNLSGGHIIMLGPGNEQAAIAALKAFPNELQVGGGITPENSFQFLDAGASHVIMTSYIFANGALSLNRLSQASKAIGKTKLVIDLSCRKTDAGYAIVMDRWQTITSTIVDESLLSTLSSSCAEFLIHAVDVEGKQSGIEKDLIILLGKHSPIPATYAGGIRSLKDLDDVFSLGKGQVDFTIGSALDIFGGTLKYRDVVDWARKKTV